jgi:hypothetical protein
MFSVGKKGEPIDSPPETVVDPEEGTEIAAVKQQLDARSVKYSSDRHARHAAWRACEGRV